MIQPIAVLIHRNADNLEGCEAQGLPVSEQTSGLVRTAAETVVREKSRRVTARMYG